jgi:hypothetical protein
LSEGPGRVRLRSLLVDERGRACRLPALETPLPGLLIPGQEASAMIRVPVPATAGAYRVALFMAPRITEKGDCALAAESSFRLIVESAATRYTDRSCAASLQTVQRALAEAENKQDLPADYLDVTQGYLAKWKRWIKHKLLGNFKHAYVDVLSRQQTAFNHQTVTALQELAECCALLDPTLAGEHAGKEARQGEQLSAVNAGLEVSSLAAFIERAVAAGKADEIALLLGTLVDQLAEVRRRFAALERRLSELEVRESIGE